MAAARCVLLESLTVAIGAGDRGSRVGEEADEEAGEGKEADEGADEGAADTLVGTLFRGIRRKSSMMALQIVLKNNRRRLSIDVTFFIGHLLSNKLLLGKNTG